jgi:hypothetical protein
VVHRPSRLTRAVGLAAVVATLALTMAACSGGETNMFGVDVDRDVVYRRVDGGKL